MTGRHCPECDLELVEKIQLGIHVDLCPGCRGIWFDSGELEAYRQRVVGGTVLSALTFEREPDVEPWNCPGCRQKTLIAGKLGKLVLDKCSSCRGVFVPRSTLEVFKPKMDIVVPGEAVADAGGFAGLEALGEVLSWVIGGVFDSL